MSSNKEALKQVKAYAPNLKVCMGAGKDPWGIVDNAIEVGAEKVQLYRQYYNQEMIDKAHANGIICNAFYADTEEQARIYLEMGVDTILTNDYLTISKIVAEYKNK
jgi:glycerophosphoryl diester phosphodiesterase